MAGLVAFRGVVSESRAGGPGGARANSFCVGVGSLRQMRMQIRGDAAAHFALTGDCLRALRMTDARRDQCGRGG